MPRVVRSKKLSVPAAEIWQVVADPYHLPRWWPKTTRVENVSEGGPRGQRWTTVLETRDGRGVRADYRCLAATQPARYQFEQIIEGTPFAAFLRSSVTEITLKDAGAGTEVALSVDQRMNGLSRFGGFMMRRATKRTLADALGGLEEAVAPPGSSR